MSRFLDQFSRRVVAIIFMIETQWFWARIGFAEARSSLEKLKRHPGHSGILLWTRRSV
jgi:hypothetical protein